MVVNFARTLIHNCSMKSVGMIFWLSEKAKEFQVLLEEEYELPTYAVFIVIAIATIVVGLALGGVSTCSCILNFHRSLYSTSKNDLTDVKDVWLKSVVANHQAQS